MNQRFQIFKCEVCGNIVDMVHPGGGQLVCCGKNMKLFVEGAVDAAKEKHVPVVEKQGNGYKVTVGSVSHPMEDKHYIEWIEIIADDRLYRQYLKPGQKPEAFFEVSAKTVIAREYCNLHGLWKKE